MDVKDNVKVSDNFVDKGKEEDDYIRRRLNWIKRNAIYGLNGSHASNTEIVEIMKGNDNSHNLEI